MNLLERIKRRFLRPQVEAVPFSVVFDGFQKVLETNNRFLDLMADMGNKLGGQYVFDRQYILTSCARISELVQQIILNLNKLAPNKYGRLYDAYHQIQGRLEAELAGQLVIPETPLVMDYGRVTRDIGDLVAGNKNANLAAVGNVLDLDIPPAFVITTRAFQAFMRHDQLGEKLKPILERWSAGELTTGETSAAVRDLILAAETPPYLAREIRQAAQTLVESAPDEKPYLAVRSSGYGEDGDLSFAGQYRSFLGVAVEDMVDRYRDVIAGAYTERALAYRRQKGFSESEVAMAVGCMLMVDAQASGVLYTVDPQDPGLEAMLISACYGLGQPLVAGLITPDRYRVSRQSPPEVIGLDVVHKEEMQVLGEEGGTETRPVPERQQSAPVLGQDQMIRLAEIAGQLEKFFKSPQDIEWALDQEGRLVVLQVRPLNVKAQVSDLVPDISQVLKSHPVIFSARGQVAQRGIATGKVFLVKNDEDLDRFPPGAVLVTKFTSPRLAKVMRRAVGVITDVGSPTGHLATIAREFRVPTIVNTGLATRVLAPDTEVTIDAEQNVVYAGLVKELYYYEFTEDAFEESYEYRLLRRVLKTIASLNLIDPQSRDFRPLGCRTFHDIARFAHERAVDELINFEFRGGPDGSPKKLEFDLPLGLTVIDVGGGVTAPPKATRVTLDQINSAPARALLTGMADPGMWGREPMAVDFGGFMSSLTRTFASHLAKPRYIGRNLAVVSKDYVNLQLRLGYHFNIIDAYVTEDPNSNYAYFRFQGGVTELERRGRRAVFLAQVLGRYDFKVEVQGDLVVARVKKMSPDMMLDKIRLMGRLVSFSRQLDVQMLSDEHLGVYFETFLELNQTDAAVA